MSRMRAMPVSVPPTVEFGLRPGEGEGDVDGERVGALVPEDGDGDGVATRRAAAGSATASTAL
jgi:hypothetical protein